MRFFLRGILARISPAASNILADEETLYAFYDARLPAEIHQTATFDSWYRVNSHIINA